MPYYVYMVTNYTRTTIYTGFTGNLVQRIEQHKAKSVNSFSRKYKTDILVYADEFENVSEARARERAIKKWNREWKDNLINKSNPNWEEILI